MLLGVPKRGFGSHPCRVVSSSYQKMVHCHGRGREFESRRPRHIVSIARERFWLSDSKAGACSTILISAGIIRRAEYFSESTPFDSSTILVYRAHHG